MGPLLLLPLLLLSGCVATGPPPAPAAPAAVEPPAPPQPPAAPAPAPAAAPQPAPPPAAAVAPQQKPEPPAPQPPLPTEAALRRLLPAAVSPYTPVTVGGRTVLLLQDVNRDGATEILAPVAALGAGAAAAVRPEALADRAGVYVEGRPRVPFFLLVLSQDGSGLATASRIDLGERYVFGGLTVVPLTSSPSGPLAVVVSFTTREGSEQEWLAFSGSSLRPVSRLSLKDTLASRPKVEDIDRNGVIDIVVHESGVEAGVGYETLLTWYRWNGTRFVEQSVINVVRNLNAFLAQTREHLVSHRWRALIDHCFAADQLRYYKGEGLSDPQVIMRGLGLAPFYGPARPELALEDIADVVFPQFQENPFSATDERGSYFLMAYRIVEATGASKVIETPLYMMRNPFAERQFFFRIR